MIPTFHFIYIDPGTGSMLFTILIGVISAGVYFLRNSFMKLRFIFSLGKQEKNVNDDRVPFAIFTDSKRYWNIFKPICDEFEKRGQKVAYLTASPDDPALNENYECVSAETSFYPVRRELTCISGSVPATSNGTPTFFTRQMM